MKVLGVCGGNGAVLYPFLENLIGNIEPRSAFKTPDNRQWKLNFHNIPLINKMADKPLIQGWDMEWNKQFKGVDIIIGHPDCGNSSMLAYSRGKKLTNPRKNQSVILFSESISRLKPKFFLFENLPKFLENFTAEEINEYFCNYRLKMFTGSVSKWGNSQVNRKRLVIVGIRRDLHGYKKYFKLPDPKDFILSTTRELIHDLVSEDEKPIMGHIREKLDDVVTLYGGFKQSLRDIQIGWTTHLKDKQRWEVIDRKFTSAPGVYKNLPEKYPNTVRKGNREFNYNGLMMSPRERARIQGIPDYFKIWVDYGKKKLAINKGRLSTTKCFPYEISEWFYKCIKEIDKNEPKIWTNTR